MEGRCELIGGPLDGMMSKRRSGAFLWFQRYGEGVRGFTAPCPGRYLYRRESAGVWLWVGDTHQRCEGCGAIVVRSACCELCLHP